MTTVIERRLAALEAAQPATVGRRMVLLPWDNMPEEQQGDMICCYQFVAPSPDGPQRLEYERNGIHPKDDVPGSWNRYLYFNEHRHA